MSTCTPRQRRRTTSRKSRMAAPLGLVTNAIRRGKRGSGLFRRASNKPSAASLAWQLPKGQLQGPQSLRLQLTNDELIAAARRIDVQLAPADHLLAVFEVESQEAGRGLPDYGSNLGCLILEREIRMAGTGGAEIRDFPRYPHRGKRLFERISNAAGELRNRENFGAALLTMLFAFFQELANLCQRLLHVGQFLFQLVDPASRGSG